MAEFYKTEKLLTNENLDLIVEELTNVYVNNIKNKIMGEVKFRLALEEILLRFRDFYGDENPCRVMLVRRFGRYYIDISAIGSRKEWLPWGEELKFSYDILARLGIEPRYEYSHLGKGRNRIIWESLANVKKRSMIFPIVTAALLAVIVGIIINLSPADIKSVIAKDLIAPVFTKLTAIISAVATPLVFFAVVCGIVGIGDIKAFGKMGTRFLRRMLSSYIVAALILGVGGILVYGIGEEVAIKSDGSALGQIVGLVLDIIPSNLFVPFGIDNDLQVIVIAIFVGITMLILGDVVTRLNDVVNDISELTNKMMLICCKLLPVIVFIGVVNLIITSNAKQFISIGKMFVVYLGMNAVFLVYMAVRASITTKTSMKKILPKQLATFIINITTASQVAALPENMKCCKEKFGIESKFVDFGLPLGVVIYMPSGAIFLGLIAWGLSITAGVPVGISSIIRIMIVGVVLAIAAPPIPGATLVVLPVLFASCGVPAETLPLGIIFGTVIGYIVPAFNGYNIQLELLSTAKKLGKLDEEKLKAVYKEE